MRLFVDAEWQNEATYELVSLALISQDRRHRFYAERDPLPDAPSSFVREVVYPLLERGSAALADAEFATQLCAFLAQFENPIVLGDDQRDFSLLTHALNSFGQPSVNPKPTYRPTLVTFGDVLARIEDYFEAHPEARKRRHHALVDAEALLWAFEGALTKASVFGPDKNRSD